MSVIVNIVLFCAHLCVLCSGTPAPIPALKPAPTSAPAHALKPASTSAPAHALKPAPTSSCVKYSLGYEFNNRTTHCYKVHGQAVSWADANRTCVAEGARLAVPNSAAEEGVLVELYERYPDEAIHDAWDTYHVFVGIYHQSGAWRTVDGQTLAQAGRANWAKGWPLNENIFPYGFMFRHGTLGSLSGSFKLAFICEMA